MYAVDRFNDINRIQGKVPSLVIGDGNCDLFYPRSGQDDKVYCSDIRKKFNKYIKAELPHLQNFNTGQILYLTVQGEKKLYIYCTRHEKTVHYCTNLRK